MWHESFILRLTSMTTEAQMKILKLTRNNMEGNLGESQVGDAWQQQSWCTTEVIICYYRVNLLVSPWISCDHLNIYQILKEQSSHLFQKFGHMGGEASFLAFHVKWSITNLIHSNQRQIMSTTPKTIRKLLFFSGRITNHVVWDHSKTSRRSVYAQNE